MQIRYFATIRDYTREQERQWNEPTGTVHDLLVALSAVYGARFRDAALAGGQLSPWIIVLVNGRDCRHLNGIDTPLQSDDTVSIFPMVAGG